jgi:hypothetical protein
MGEWGDYGSPSLSSILAANDLATIEEVLVCVLAIKYHFKIDSAIPRSYVEMENPAYPSALCAIKNHWLDSMSTGLLLDCFYMCIYIVLQDYQLMVGSDRM